MKYIVKDTSFIIFGGDDQHSDYKHVASWESGGFVTPIEDSKGDFSFFKTHGSSLTLKLSSDKNDTNVVNNAKKHFMVKDGCYLYSTVWCSEDLVETFKKEGYTEPVLQRVKVSDFGSSLIFFDEQRFWMMP